MSRRLLALLLAACLLLSARCSAAPGADASRDTCASCGGAQRDPEDPESRLSGDFLEAVKRHILSRLQMRQRPNITQPLPRAAMVTALRKLHAGRLLEDGRLEIPELDGHPTGSQVLEENSEIISFAEKDDLVTSKSSLFFLISSEGNQNLEVVQATLWLYFRLLPSELRGRRKVTVKVYYQEPGLGSRWNLVERRVELKRSGWHTFGLTDAVRLVFQKGDRRQNLDVRCEGCEVEGVLPVLLGLGDESHRPFLVVQARQADAKHRIRKRGLECDGSSSLCCRQQFYIDFRLIGWNDWIIAPPGYHANYCEGECPSHVASITGSTLSFHSTVISHYRMRGYSPFQNLRSCCVPTRLRAMSMLYYNEEQKIIKKDIQNMIVEECGCS